MPNLNLSSSTSGAARYVKLCQHLTQLLNKYRTNWKKGKLKKLRKLIRNKKKDKPVDNFESHPTCGSEQKLLSSTADGSNFWIKDLDLRIADKTILINNCMLTDKHIYESQKLIRKDFPNIIQQTCFLSKDKVYQLVPNLKQNKVIQIYNNGSLHWVVSTNNEDKNVFLYDSRYTTFNQAVLKQTDQIYSMVPLNKNVTQKTGRCS